MQAATSGKLKSLMPLISLALVALAVAVIQQQIHTYHWHEIQAAVFGIPPHILLGMLGLTLLGYLSLGLYDFLGLEYAGERLAWRRILFTSFLGYAISNNLGHALISGGSLRYRLYSGWGISGIAIARTVLFCTLTYILGAIALMLAGYAMLPADSLIARHWADHAGVQNLVIAAGAVVLTAWWGLVLFYRRDINIRGFTIAVPSVSLAVRQMLVALLDLLLASLVLYLPLAHVTDMPYGSFLVLYILAQLLGLFSQVPGGIGIFEGSFLFLTAGQFPSALVLGALIAYRAVYYFVPLLLAGIVLTLYELKPQRWAIGRGIGAALDGLESAIPHLFSILLLFGGAVLLFSGATPAVAERLRWLHFMLPLPMIEFSHLMGSMAGVVLLFLSRAVGQRMDAAYYATIGVLGLGIFASLAKGVDYEEASILGLLLLMILPAHKHFYRKSSLLALDFPLPWLGLIALIIGVTAWLGFFSYKHVEYSDQLWWQFSLHGDAPRFLRSLVAISVLACGLAVYVLLTHPRSTLDLPDREQLARARELAGAASGTMPHLALLGDKYLLWSESGNSFLMFDTTARLWVAMGDTVGDPAEQEELAWKFRELADRHGARIAFYQVGQDNLPLYLDFGLSLVKLGEEARVPLSDFALAGKRRQSLRHAHNKITAQGIEFVIVPAADVAAILPRLRAISDAWLEAKDAREKRFSLGYFDEAYLSGCDIAIARRGDDILAFANLWQTDSREELSIDLMRYAPGCPNGVMEFLTVSLMLWGREQGYRWFNLGMAPLSGLKGHPLAPAWQRIGHTIFRFGGEFYNFEGLYNYKDKFNPQWQPRYLAAPSGWQVASTLLAVTGLISGGLEGVIRK